MKYISILFIFFFGCVSLRIPPKIGVATDYVINNSNAKAVRCLGDLLVGEDAGGQWTAVSAPVGAVIPALVGDNPCVNITTCGAYVFKYRLVNACCKDSVSINILKCCIIGTSTCNEL